MINKEKGITLVALVVTIVVLVILAAVSINVIFGENGLLTKAREGAEETNKQTAAEKMNLKITNIQILSYAEKTRMPTLQELADKLCEDKEIEYVELESKAVAALDKIVVGENSSIFTKIKQYPYEFEINSSLQLASIDGIKIAESEGTVSNEQYEELINRLTALETDLQNTKTELETSKKEIESNKQKIATLEDETIVNKRIKLMNSSTVSIPLTTSWVESNFANINLSESMKNYKYLEIQIEVNDSTSGHFFETTVFIATESLSYNNSNTANWTDGSTFNLVSAAPGDYGGISCWFKDATTLHVGGSVTDRSDWISLTIKNIYGIK